MAPAETPTGKAVTADTMGGSMPVNSLGFLSSPTTITDLEMLDTNLIEQRPSLPTALSDFALFPSSSSAPPSPSSILALDDGVNPFFRRLRRPSLLATNAITAATESKSTSSPLSVSFRPRTRRAQSFDSEKMADDSSSEPPSATTSIIYPEPQTRVSTSAIGAETPRTPPRPSSPTSPSSTTASQQDISTRLGAKRISLPLKPARLLDLRTEINSPIDSELKSEAEFQRLIASYSTGFPPSKHLPHTPRAWSDRGRFPEEAGGDDDAAQEDSGSDDGDDLNAAGSIHSVSMTPSGSGEDQPMTIDTNMVGGFMMDIDMPSSISSPTHWRQTPPPTSSAVRSNKRKFDDRYDPYPLAAKRRAVSPSVHSHPHHSYQHSHQHSHSHSHSHSHHHSRSNSSASSHVHPSAPPLSIPIPIPRAARSVTSSPVMRPISSPVMRPSSFTSHSPICKGTSSPTLRPIARLPPLATLRGGSDGEREKSRKGVDGAGEGVGSLSLV